MKPTDESPAGRFVERLSGEATTVVLAAPATPGEVAAVEDELGLRLPARFREMLLVANGVRFFGFEGLSRGDEVSECIAPAVLGTSSLGPAAKQLRAWAPGLGVTTRLSLPFTSDGNGDSLVFDLRGDAPDAPVYRAHHAFLDLLGGADENAKATLRVAPSFSAYLDALAGAIGRGDWSSAETFF